MSCFWNEKEETMSRHEMELLQSYRLIEMVRRIYNNVPFYKQKFDEAGIKPEDIRGIEDLSKLPFTYKQDIRDNYPYGLFCAPLEDVVRIHASSGTTGKQTVVGYTQKDINDWSDCVARALYSIGTRKNDFVHVSYGYGLFTGGLGLHYGAERMGAITIPVSTGNTKRQVQIFQDFGSSIICCTPSYALYIAETMEEMGVDKSALSLKAGFFGAEPWTEQMREEIERRLGIKARDIYGLSEISGPGVAFECIEGKGMHINEDFFIPEIIDPDMGEVLPEGSWGELVFTTVTKECIPLLRYRTRDISCLTYEKCECGRTLVRMKKPSGRTDDMLIIRGINVFPSQIESVLLELGYATPYYQLIVDRKGNLDTLEVDVEMTNEMFSDEVKGLESVEAEIKRALDSTLNISAKVKLVEPKSLPRVEGKAKRVIDNRKA